MTQFYPVYFVTGATLVDNEVQLKVNGNPTIADHNRFVIRFAPNVKIPSGVVADTPVYLNINGTNYQVLDKYAEPLVMSEIPVLPSVFSPRLVITGAIGVGSENTYFIAWNIPIIC